jgi:glycosyltransferase involved in cell wall biosynthesis
MSIRVLHVAHGVEQEQLGAGRSVPRLCRALAEQGIEVILAALDLGGKMVEGVCETGNLEFQRFPYIGPRRIGYSPQLKSFVNSAVKKADIVQTHFLWAYPQALAARLALRNQKPLVKTIHGALFPEAMSKSKLAKFIWYQFIDGPSLEEAQCLVATSESEAKCIEDRFQPKRLEIIPDAIELPVLPGKAFAAKRAQEILGNPERKYVLYLGHLHPHKNLERLIAAWSGVRKKWPEHVLMIVGPGPGRYVRYLQRFIERWGLAESAKLCGPIYEPDKWLILDSAEAVVLPSRSENFGLVVAEALYCGTPVVAGRGTPWACLETEGFGHWVNMEDDLLSDAIDDVLSWPAERRRETALKARTYIQENFIWRKVTDQYIRLYRDLLQ